MAKIRTNIFEMLLNELLIGKTIYDDDDNPFVVDNVRYTKTNTVFAIDASGNTSTFFIDDNIDIDMPTVIKEVLDKKKIKKVKNKRRHK